MRAQANDHRRTKAPARADAQGDKAGDMPAFLFAISKSARTASEPFFEFPAGKLLSRKELTRRRCSFFTKQNSHIKKFNVYFGACLGGDFVNYGKARVS